MTNWNKLSMKKLKCLFIYFITIFVIGLITSIFSLLYETLKIKLSITLVSIIGGFGCSLIGCSIFYLRKLYKQSINIKFESPETEEDLLREIGVYYYYFLRPFFALGFSILIHIVLKSSIKIVTLKEAILSSGFIYLSMFFSFFGGFACGDLLTYIESLKTKIVQNIFKD